MSAGADEGPRRVGRPRADRLRRQSGRPPREELLCAAAELFTDLGYAATTTRAVAERAGMRQATMYHHFGGKEDLLAELLESTVAPSLALARELLADTARPAARRLWELCRSDVLLLCGGPHHLGALYLLPEPAGARFARFHHMRGELRDAYRELLAGTRAGAELAGDGAGLALRNDLVFGLIEGVMLIHRAAPTRPVHVFAEAAADAALRIAGVLPDAA
ncbi:TetR family transcriptional regulator [Streptomyces subrutilus]|uniref:TetR family transcriptional regulator n=1 Tax=Streptomyces subrutilus TaxID=36818 RepID=A0A5P2USV7_9ACTN|nr:TetR/AcrR family transcriptional regulator [Streptomyces subrutilus]QEU81355.1 TetR/AcrR family transcriptional regulator [Streptomyces subrutilus]GGZ87301.1 TetR family transcriptional regulator [Streptomyces subrutilus]